MQREDEIIKKADKIIHAKVMEEGKQLEAIIGPVTYKDPDDFDVKESFQKLLKDREALKAQLKETDKIEEADEPSKKTPDKRSKKIAKKTKKLSPLVKAAVVVFVAGVCFVGFGLQSEATRMWWMKSIGLNVGENSSTRIDNDEERDVTVLPEKEAAAVIKKEVGIKVPEFIYIPEDLVYSSYAYEDVNNSACVFYEQLGDYLTLDMAYGDVDSASSFGAEGGALQEEDIETAFGSVHVREFKAEGDEKETVVAEWDYQDVHYRFFGRIDFDEMCKMVETMIL